METFTTQDGKGRIVAGKRGDLLVYCNNCAATAPLLVMTRTARGQSIRYQRYKGVDLRVNHDDDGGQITVMIACQSCGETVTLDWGADIMYALGQSS